MQSRDLGTRFEIKGFPTLKMFSKGKIYTYEGRRNVEDLVAFAKGGFTTADPEDVPKPQGYFGEITKTFTKVCYEYVQLLFTVHCSLQSSVHAMLAWWALF